MKGMSGKSLWGQTPAAWTECRSQLAPSGYWHLTAGRASLLLERRALVVNLLLLVLLLAASTAYLMAGSIPVSLAELARALSGDGEVVTLFVIHDLRLPRLAASWLTGAAFAVAGCLMQTLARNRLATPGIIGIDNG
ncbi:iron chelate uptake ABC transporter family permease subunit, partial [Halomonas sp. BM-2019]|uniref:iron chelate uptake ABC transporter family permease subunit n=1 Tax=Halomonas sp. BM-2019 TaxID=2811227 RepID=UPI0031FBF8C4